MVFYLSIIIINMVYVPMYLFNYSMLILVMVMSCDIVRDTNFMFYFICKITVIIKINTFIYFSYIVSISSVNGIMLINSNLISKIIICFLYIMCFYLSYSY